ncbi:leucyl/phenylalanyl-tRNA--protein transferase, partial [bacterium]|nr:leucyl/phenylalanyl-tRNA--protein transferase [bacterium]
MSKTLPPSPQLLWAYSQGFFPMPNLKDETIEWYRPDPRAVLPLDQFHVSRSLRKVLNRDVFSTTLNKAFPEVVFQCANRPETWINAEFKRAYGELHHLGHAHSLEVWEGNELAGGVYGVQLGGAFFAESMFSLRDNASKVALYELSRHLKSQNFLLLEIQFLTPHLASLGAVEIPDT